ncbi:MAG: DUF4340 domain-containing protein [Planctomycetota bacterium]
MNFRTTLVLLALLLGLLGGYLLLGGGPSSTTPPAGPAAEPWVTGRAFSRIEIDRPDHPTLALEAQPDGSWRQVTPVRFPVTDAAVEAIVNAALSLDTRRVLSEEDAAGVDLGLDPPRAVLTLMSETGTHTLEVGRVTPAGTVAVRRAGGGDVAMVDPSRYGPVLDADPTGWRPEALPGPEPGSVVRVESPRWTLYRRDGGWYLHERDGERADAAAAEALAGALTGLRPLAYVAEDPDRLADFGLEVPVLTLRVDDAAGRRVTLRVGQPADLARRTVYATWSETSGPSPVVFTLPAAPLEALRIEREALRDPRPALTPADAVRAARVNRVGRNVLSLSRADGAARFVEPTPGYPPDPAAAAAWLEALPRAVASAWVRSPPEAQGPLAIVELTAPAGRDERIRLYEDRDGRDDALLAVREDEPVAAVVPRSALMTLLDPAVTLRRRDLPPTTPTDGFTQVRLERDDGHVFAFNRDADGAWSLAGHADAVWERDAFAELLAWLETPRAEAWTAQVELPRGPVAQLSTGPQAPAYSVNVELGLAQRTDLTGVFRVPRRVADLLAGEYRPRLVLPYRVEQLRQVTLGVSDPGPDATAPPTATIRRGGDGVYRDADGQPLADPRAAAVLFDTLAGLTAKRFVPDSVTARPTPVKSYDLTLDDGATLRLRRYNQGLWSLDDGPAFFIDVGADRRLTDKDAPWGGALEIVADPTP